MVGGIRGGVACGVRGNMAESIQAITSVSGLVSERKETNRADQRRGERQGKGRGGEGRRGDKEGRRGDKRGGELDHANGRGLTEPHAHSLPTAPEVSLAHTARNLPQRSAGHKHH